MNKLATLLATSTIMVCTASAHNITTGFYAGGTVGYSSASGKASADLLPTGSNDEGVASTPGSIDVGSSNTLFGIHAGYGWVNACTYFGGELSYIFDNTKIKNNSGLLKFGSNIQKLAPMQVKRNGYVNAALRMGYLFTPSTLFYVRLGVNRSRWKISDVSLRTVNTDTGDVFGNNNITGSKTHWSFVPGAGLETAVYKNVYLRGEYTYEFGPTVRGTSNEDSAVSSIVKSLRIHSFKFGLSYKF